MRKNKHTLLPGKALLTAHRSGHSIFKAKYSSSYELKQRNTAKQANMFDRLFFPFPLVFPLSLWVSPPPPVALTP